MSIVAHGPLVLLCEANGSVNKGSYWNKKILQIKLHLTPLDCSHLNEKIVQSSGLVLYTVFVCPSIQVFISMCLSIFCIKCALLIFLKVFTLYTAGKLLICGKK